MLIGAGGAVVFWFLDALWKVNQRVYYPRLREIEQYFAGGASTKPFQVSQSRVSENARRPKFWRTLQTMREPVAALPHAAVALAGFVLFIAAPPEPASSDNHLTTASATRH